MSARDLPRWNPTIRVGMPLVSGRLLDLGVQSGLPLLFSANAYARVNAEREFVGFRVDAAARLPETLDAALDSAGFTASVAYPDYRWTLAEYLDLVEARPWRWAACPDYCVEPQIATDAAVRRLRIDATVSNYFRTLWAVERRKIEVPILPVVQGWYAEEYVDCARRMFGDIASNWPKMIGIGSVCRRELRGPAGVMEIVSALDAVMPPQTAVHLFGVKSGALTALAPFAHRVASVDSLAWDMAVRRAKPTGRTQEMRAAAMVEWHSRQVQALQKVQSQSGFTFPGVAAAPRTKTALECALEATGCALAGLYETDDLTYLDVKMLTMQDSYVVEALIRSEGPDAFAQAEPDDDRVLGIVYTATRDALVCARHLAVAEDDFISAMERQRHGRYHLW